MTVSQTASSSSTRPLNALALALVVCVVPACSSTQQSPSNAPTAPQTESQSTSSEAPSSRESQHLAGLLDSGKSPSTLRALIQEFDALAANGTATPEAQHFISTFDAPVSKAYVAQREQLDSKLRQQVINLLVSFNTEATSPAHATAIRAAASSPGAIEEAIWACQFAQKHTSNGLAEALLEAFKGINMSDKDGRRLGTHVRTAMLNQAKTKKAMAQWPSMLMEKLSQPLVRPERFDDKEAARAFNNGLYWQQTALAVLAEQQEPKAARLVLLVLLNSEKQVLHPEAESAWLRFGKDALGSGVALLEGSDAELVAAADASWRDAKEPHLAFGAKVLGDLGHPDSRAALISAYEGTRIQQSKVLLVLALTHLPPTVASSSLFKKTLRGTPPSLMLPRGAGAFESLAAAAPLLFDPSLAPFLKDTAKRVRGTWVRRSDIERAVITSLAELVSHEDADNARTIAQRYGDKTSGPAFEEGSQMAKKCKTDASCYLRFFEKSDRASQAGQAQAFKALTMLGVYGKAEQRNELLKQLTSVAEPPLRLRLTRTIEQLTVSVDAEVLKSVEKQLDAVSQDDPALQAALESLYYRLSARRG